MASWRLSATTSLIAWTLASCAESEAQPPQRDCRAIVWAQPRYPSETVRVIGSWDDWASPGLAMQPRDDVWQALALDLPAGEYGYLLVDGGGGRIDEHNPLTSFRASDGLEVSWLEVEDCGEPALIVAGDDLELVGDQLVLHGQFLAAASGDPLDPASVRAAGLATLWVSPSEARFELHGTELARGRQRFDVRARDEAGREAAAEVSVFVDPLAASWSDAIVYQVMIDRFRGPAGAPLSAPQSPGARAGGTLDGVTAAIEDGYFESLGVTALWLSPVYENPEEARLGTDGRLYEGYHGYWPVDTRRVDPRIGGEAALRELIAAAHARGLAVILDVVPNHVYETNPIVAQTRELGWFNEHPSECVCGTPSCPWSGFMQDCWFAPYLPDFRHEHPDAMRYVVGEVAWLVDEFQLDGVRVDAVPMMPRAASRRLVHALRQLSTPGDDRIVLGEVFTGAGPSGVAGLRHYLGPDGLDSVFDFPTMWAIRDVLATRSAGFVSLDALLDLIDEELEGSGAVLGRMLGNHDVPRFCSVAHGDAGGDPWDDPAAQVEDDPELFDRVALALTLQLTLPGMPVIYYGDELGLAGAGDPDNRRVLPDVATLSPGRVALLERARTLGQLRRCFAPLRSDVRETLHVGEDSYAFARGSADEVAIVVLSRADVVTEIELPGGSIPKRAYRDALSGATLDLTASTSVALPPRSAMVLLPEDSPCVNF